MLLCVLSFTEFLRFSEVINLKCSDIISKETHMSIFTENSKTNAYREGYWMHLSKLQSALCSVKFFWKYIEAKKIKEAKEKFVLRQICHEKQGFKMKNLDKPISYMAIRRHFTRRCVFRIRDLRLMTLPVTFRSKQIKKP